MKIKAVTVPFFDQAAKKLSKKYRSINRDVDNLLTDLEKNPEQGVLLQPNVRKIRMQITTKNKGKSGGARVITYFDVLATFQEPNENEGQLYQTVFLLTIYDKSEQDSISSKEIIQLLEEMGF